MSQSLLQFVLDRRPTAKQLILSVLSQPAIETMTVGQIIAWGGLFDHEPASMRVTAARLTKQGLLASPGRGLYTIGAEGETLRRTAHGWRRAEARIGPWSGGWLCVHTAHLGRTNKTALRARERAFRLTGFADLLPGLACRPDNLAEAPTATFARLAELGLEPEALLVQACTIEGAPAATLGNLWPRAALETRYGDCNAMMAASQSRLPGLGPEAATRESFLVGEFVIRQITADPLLPDAMIDAGLRRRMIDDMRAYDAFCAPIWVDFVSRIG